MSKERLKEMQHMIGMFDGDVEITLFGHKINSEYVMGEIKWLYQQVQKLEAIIEQDERQAVLEGLYEQNKRYREVIDSMRLHAHYPEIIKQIYEALEDE